MGWNPQGRGSERGGGREGEGRGKEEKGRAGRGGKAGNPQIFRWIDAFASKLTGNLEKKLCEIALLSDYVFFRVICSDAVHDITFG